MRCILAIDTGGSKCDALLVRDDGTVLGYGYVDANDPFSGRGRIGSGRSLKSISYAVRQAIGDNICDELILVGFHRTLPPINFSELQVGTIRLHNVTEYDPAFALTGESHGVVVLAGTGAVVHGQTPDGRYRTLDGLGPLLGDHGGGYHIGLMAIRAVAKSFWHTRHATALTEKVFEALDIEQGYRGVNKLVEFMLDNPDRSEIACFAKIVDAVANAGDCVARNILCKAADSIAESTRDVVDYLGIAEDNLPVIGTGSVIMYSSIYWERFCERVGGFAPKFRLMHLQEPPVLGMALKVLQQMECGNNASLRLKMIESYQVQFGTL